MQPVQTHPKRGSVTSSSHGTNGQNSAKKALNMYKSEQVVNLSPVEIIKRAYDLAIVALKKNDTEKALRILRELSLALDYSQGELAVQLFHIYQYCMRCLRQNRTDEVVSMLEELRSTWADAFNLK